MKKLLILIPTMVKHELLKKCVESINTKHDYDIVIINNWDDDDTIWFTMDLEEQGIEVQYYPDNLGVAASWNIALKRIQEEKYQYALICNDDIVFNKETIDRLIEAADKNSDNCIVFSNKGWSCYLITKRAIDNVGFFDENFCYAYLEDIDYMHRMTLLGEKYLTLYEADVEHAGSATIKHSEMLKELNHISHGANFTYMYDKWGLTRANYTDTPERKHPYGNEELTPKDWIYDPRRREAIKNVRNKKRREMEFLKKS